MIKKLVIFDFDGVIYDSEPLHLKAFNAALTSIKKEITRSIYYEEYCSFDDKGVFTTLLKKERIDFNDGLINKLIESKHRYFDKYHDSETSIYPGVLDLISRLSKKYILAIGSGARRLEIVRILNKENIISHFETIVSSDETNYPKPNPETYIQVLDRINETYQVDSNESVVVEDTPKGIIAAKSSGMKCIGITNALDSVHLSDADTVVKTYEEIDQNLINSL
ncbi:MAG TPA: HAD family phosphatase [Candidatus Dadabacteria bacterium]|nr:HAD family phosphatase [Candidatus Dadabacteria bacterium]